ncbi:hypothetical protein GJQ57_12695 [Ralstonia pickettii]|uniref:Uncharacterized protein n=1 Tax=Ralstonia pickettii TaxID=329 RepID=A0A7X2HMY5_RALPI|nr:hypothetical protein [Ralstonia pickettii]MRS99503.1 hypothetical protein [Ralstonia pickettii]NWK44910.1 hypothetical protein [Ralstonia pickettii]OCS48543.1 hypothetical protein BEK67_21250 [Ralstonia pickettii]
MPEPVVTDVDVRRMHRFLRLTTPYDAMSPLLRTAVTAAAKAMVTVRERRRANRATVDLKRRAAGDVDD